MAAAVVGALTGTKVKAQERTTPGEQPKGADRPGELTLRVLRMVGPQARIELLQPGTEYKELS
jgi:hypothetical protein